MVTDSARFVISPGTRAVDAWRDACAAASRGSAAEHCSRTRSPHCSRVAAGPESSSSDRAEMGYAAHMRFAPDELALLTDSEEIEIETARPGGPAPPDDHLGRRRWRRRLHPFGQRRRGALVSRGDRRPVGHHPRRRTGAAGASRSGDRPGLDPPHERAARAKICHIHGHRCGRCSCRTSLTPRCGSSPPDDRRPARTRRLEPTTDVLR